MFRCIKGAPGKMSRTCFTFSSNASRIFFGNRLPTLNMIFAVSILLLVAAVNSQVPDYRYRPYNYDETPKPYAFSYNAVLDDGIGQISRQETADGSGRVQGSYSLANDEGHTRVVEYIADQDGFRAHVRTNEPGTDNQNPADVTIESSSPYANRNYQNYAPVNPINRRPVLNVGPEPLAPEVVPVNPAAPENVIPPVNRPAYRRPPSYRRPAVRNPYGPY